jgi:hypothetical protein
MKNLSRRNFLKAGSFATAGLSLMPETVFSSVGNNSPVRIGVIGVGSRGSRHISTLLKIEGVEIVSVFACISLSEIDIINLEFLTSNC